MPLDQPTFPFEREVNLQAGVLTSAVCSNPQYAIDDDPATAAVFGSPPLIPFVPPVFANAFMDPAGDGSPLQWTPSTGSVHFNLIAKGVHGANPTSAPGTNPDTSTFLSYDQGDVPEDPIDIYTFGSAPLVASPVAFITVWIYGLTAINGDPVYVSLKQGGSFLTPVLMNIPNPGGWNFATFSPLGGFSQSDLDALQLQVQGLFVAEGGTVRMDAAYVAFGYSVPEGTTKRFLRVDWGAELGDRYITRIRLKQDSTAGISNTGISFESSYGFHAEGDPPPEIPFQAYLPLPLGGGVHELYFDPPVLARGIVVYPDEYLANASELPPAAYPTVSLYQLQVYENITYQEGIFSMGQTGPNPVRQPARVGCSGLQIYPWVESSSYPFANGAPLYAIQGLDLDKKVTKADVRGGDSIHRLAEFETYRDSSCKFMVEQVDYRLFLDILSGTLIVDAADGNGPETQYFTEELSDHAPYFTIVALSINGDPQERLVLVKAKYSGLTDNRQTDKVTDYEVAFDLSFDKTYIRQDGQVGGIMERMFTNNANPAFHS